MKRSESKYRTLSKLQTKGRLIAIAAPSGTGKTTIVKSILKSMPELKFSVSATTRKKRDVEVHGVDYFFLTEEEFLQKIQNDEFLEWEKFYDYYYGTLKEHVFNIIDEGNSVVLEVDVKGALNIKKIFPDTILIFIEPPSFEELVKRLENRKTETSEDLQKRIKRAEMELSLKNGFDYSIVNNKLDDAISEVASIIKENIYRSE